MSPVQGYAGPLLQRPAARPTRASSRARSSPPACGSSTSATRTTRRRSRTSPRRRARARARARPSNYAMSRPAFVPERGEIWYTDGNSGFYNVRAHERRLAVHGGLGPGGERRHRRRRRCTRVGRLPLGLGASRRGRGLRLAYDAPARAGRSTVDVFQVAKGRRVVQRAPRRALRRHRDVVTVAAARAARRHVLRPLQHAPRRASGSTSSASCCAAAAGASAARRGHHRRASCGLLRQFKLERPVFGGTRRTPLRIAYRLVVAGARRRDRPPRRPRRQALPHARAERGPHLPPAPRRARPEARRLLGAPRGARAGRERVVATLRARRL